MTGKFQDFPAPNSFSRTFQVLQISGKKSRTSQEEYDTESY